ncbi:hypothetical protein M404DRAFT_22448 [Pisolithus tinctorius Marx 270]|uniref:Uncharacterized protein n=1 Tax=Pisolithus tinctorius Marx 270 TaxID=870435 RepID=A0A0C3P793_PISTI|nr:hypothetical protein M404DRAFT_22448 [Pisolithus tinctorius Marx 270]
MSELRLIVTTDNNNKGHAIIDWTQEEVMKAKSKESKRQKAAEQAWWEEQVQLEAKRVEREWIEAERAERERVEVK